MSAAAKTVSPGFKCDNSMREAYPPALEPILGAGDDFGPWCSPAGSLKVDSNRASRVLEQPGIKVLASSGELPRFSQRVYLSRNTSGSQIVAAICCSGFSFVV